MKIYFKGIYSLIPKQLLRKCGYAEYMNRQGKISYVRQLGGKFPRFHAYVDTTDEGFRVNLHLDQKGACYKGSNAHSGEYEDGPVITEAQRVKTVIESLKRVL